MRQIRITELSRNLFNFLMLLIQSGKLLFVKVLLMYTPTHLNLILHRSQYYHFFFFSIIIKKKNKTCC